MKHYDDRIIEFENGLIVFLGDPNETDPMMADPFCWYDADEYRDWTGNELSPADAEYSDDEIRDALYHLYDNYLDSEDFNDETWNRVIAVIKIVGLFSWE